MGKYLNRFVNHLSNNNKMQHSTNEIRAMKYINQSIKVIQMNAVNSLWHTIRSNIRNINAISCAKVEVISKYKFNFNFWDDLDSRRKTKCKFMQ